MLHCALCREPVDPDEVVHCKCGQVLHPRCAENHRTWCAATGEEAWIGARER